MNIEKTTNILLVGVGGQGIVLASEVLASVCIQCGLDVKQNEVHGMAQRGGSVSSNVRFGTKVYSPTIEPGKADILLSFELLEAARWSHFLKPDGVIIVNNQRIDPMPVASGAEQYPTDITAKLSAKKIVVDGNELAIKAGNIKAVNVALLGVLSVQLDFNKDIWIKAIKDRVPAKTIDINLKAFNLGREYTNTAK